MTRPFIPWTRQGRFLRALARTGCVAVAARAAGIDKRTAYRWRRAKPDFARRWTNAQELALDAICDVLVERALLGVPRPIYRRCGPTAGHLRLIRGHRIAGPDG